MMHSTFFRLLYLNTGATLMASGSSAPELATSVISLFVAKVVF